VLAHEIFAFLQIYQILRLEFHEPQASRESYTTAYTIWQKSREVREHVPLDVPLLVLLGSWRGWRQVLAVGLKPYFYSL